MHGMKDEPRTEAAAQGELGWCCRATLRLCWALKQEQEWVLVAAPALCPVFPQQWHGFPLFPCFKAVLPSGSGAAGGRRRNEEQSRVLKAGAV